MAMPNCPSHNLGLDLGLGLGKKLVSTSRGRKQRRGVAVKKRLFDLQVVHLSGMCLAWSSSWGSPLHFQPAGKGQIASLGRNVTGFGSENLNEKSEWNAITKTFLSTAIIFGLLARLYLQLQSRVPASSSPGSSSFSGSSGVDATAENRGRELKQYYDDNGNLAKFEDQSSFRESDTFSGGWESEQDLVEAEFAERNHSSQGVSTRDTEECFEGNNGTLHGGVDDDSQEEELWEREGSTSDESSASSSSPSTPVGTPSIGPKEPVYEVIEVSQLGKALKKLVSRRQLLRTSGLRLRDLRRVDPSLWVTNSAPALLVRDQAILLNLGSLRAIATTQEVLIFDHQSKGARLLLETLIPRLNDHQHGSVMPFELEVIESALISRTRRLEQALMDVEPRVIKLLEVLPTCMTADVLEELRVSKQALVEVGAKAGALRQMLLELLEHPHDIRRMAIMGRMCSVGKDGNSVDCTVPQDRQVAEDEEEEMEMLLEYYLQRCESTHGQAEKLLSSAKEMEDSIAVNLSSRRLEVSRLELLLQVGTFCAALGALVAGIFGMNLKSYLEERALAFYFTTFGIIFGGIALFLYMFNYLSNRKIL